MASSLCRQRVQLVLRLHLKNPGGRLGLRPPRLEILGTFALKMMSRMFLDLVKVTRGGSGKYSLASTSLAKSAVCLFFRIPVTGGRRGSYGIQKTGLLFAAFWTFTKAVALDICLALSIAACTTACL